MPLFLSKKEPVAYVFPECVEDSDCTNDETPVCNSNATCVGEWKKTMGEFLFWHWFQLHLRENIWQYSFYWAQFGKCNFTGFHKHKLVISPKNTIGIANSLGAAMCLYRNQFPWGFFTNATSQVLLCNFCIGGQNVTAINFFFYTCISCWRERRRQVILLE